VNRGVREVYEDHSTCDGCGTENDDSEYCDGDGDDDDDDKYVKWICCEQIAQLHYFLTKKTK